MDDNSKRSTSLPAKELQSELIQLQAKLQKAEEKIMSLELALMQSRDFAIGSAAQAGEAVEKRGFSGVGIANKRHEGTTSGGAARRGGRAGRGAQQGARVRDQPRSSRGRRYKRSADARPSGSR